MLLNRIHHMAIICSDYAVSKRFYTEILELPIVLEHYRKERDSYKLDLKVGDYYQIELFSFPNPPSRPSRPEATGLRHLCFEVDDLDASIENLRKKGIKLEDTRVDELSGKRFTFFADPDGLPLELYER